jgi:hypothetical protein
MSRYLGTLPIERVVYLNIVSTNPILYKDHRGRPVIELPNPDATWQACPIFSQHTAAWIQGFFSQFRLGAWILTKAEIDRVALLLAADAYVTASLPHVLPFDQTMAYAPLLECVVEFMVSLRVNNTFKYEDSITNLRVELVKSAKRHGFPEASIHPSVAVLGKQLKQIVDALRTSGIVISFFRTAMIRQVILEWIPGKMPILDGRDGHLPQIVTDVVIPNSGNTNNLPNSDGNDGSDGQTEEPDYESLKPSGEIDK